MLPGHRTRTWVSSVSHNGRQEWANTGLWVSPNTVERHQTLLSVTKHCWAACKQMQDGKCNLNTAVYNTGRREATYQGLSETLWQWCTSEVRVDDHGTFLTGVQVAFEYAQADQRTGSKAQYRIAWIPGAKGIYTLGAKRKARQGKFLNPILTEPPLFTTK